MLPEENDVLVSDCLAQLDSVWYTPNFIYFA